MGARERGPWFENPQAVSLLLVLMLLMVTLVWVVGVGAAFVETAGR
ncbi:MAG: hypothetical protein ACYC3S_17270 [Chloroflexota bacterium]